MPKSVFPPLMKIVPLAFLFATALTAVAQSKLNYEIYAIRYATLPASRLRNWWRALSLPVSLTSP